MFNSSDFSSNDLLRTQLIDAFKTVSISPDKRVFQTDSGIRALSSEESKTDASAHLIGVGRLERLSQNLDKLQSGIQSDYTKALSVFLETLGVTAILDEGKLKFTAETEGFGYKKANLDQISMLAKEGFGSYQIKVPEYSGIPSDSIQKFLKNCDIDIAPKWKQIIEKNFPSQKEREEVLRSKKFPEQFFIDCALFRNDISNAIHSLIIGGQDLRNLNSQFDVTNLDALIDLVKTQKERLMARSTGKEDTKELANAGGNTSVANVAPVVQDILKALTNVVISYFDEKSLKQRLGVEDKSLFDTNPFTPVLIQRMIGEQDPQAIPKCGVMFTEDTESTISNPLEETATSGITVIQSAYGHNEGVVNSLIPVDTYYVNETGDIFPILRHKTYRMMPTEQSGELQLVANNSKPSLTSSLSKEAIVTLKNFSERLEQFYGGAMDVEFVVDEKENTIYIVQARPIVHRRNSADASYISNLEKLGSTEILKGSAIVASGGSLRLARPSQIIAASNLTLALEDYQACDNPMEIEVVIVGKPAFSTSHWATTFRSEGKPVIYVEDLASVISWLENPDSQILISPQQGFIVNLGIDKQISLEELQREGICNKGCIDYPAAPLFSAVSQFQPREKLDEEAIISLCPALRDPQRWEEFQIHAIKFPLRKIFDELQESQGENLKLNLAILLYQFKICLERNSEMLLVDKDQQLLIDALQSYALALAKSIKNNGEHSSTDAHFSRKLLPIHFLRALVYSQASAIEVVDGHSLTSVALREMAQETIIVKELQKEGVSLQNPYSLPLLRVTKMALTSEIATQFKNLVINFDQGSQNNTLEILSYMIVKLNELDQLSAWLNIIFPRNPDIQQLIKAFKNQLPYFTELAKKKEILNAMSIEAFGFAKSFPRQWETFNSQLLTYVKNEEFVTAFTKADISGKLTSISLMNKIVNQFDLAIKTLEGSSEYSEEKKLVLFQQMLKGYCELAVTWLNNFNFPQKEKDLIRHCLETASHAVNKKELTSADLRFSYGFDVQAYGSRSGVILRSFDGVPTTLEDGFSIIHQELLSMLSILTLIVSGKDFPEPPLLQNAIQKLQFNNPTGREINKNGIIIHYTVPLREHGVNYTLHYTTETKNLTLEVRFSALDVANERWKMIGLFMQALKIFGKFNITDFELSLRGIGYSFQLDENDDLTSLRRVLNIAEEATFELRFGKGDDLGMQTINSVKNNSEKGLKTMTNAKMILQEFEKNFGIANIVNSKIVLMILRKLVKSDPLFVKSFLERLWRCKFILDDDSTSYELNINIPSQLINSNHDLSTFCTRSIQLMNSTSDDDMQKGITLMNLITEKNPDILPNGIVKPIFKVLLQTIQIREKLWDDEDDPFKQALEILEKVMNRGMDAELILEGLVTILEAKNKFNDNDGLKVVDILISCRQNYSESFKKELIDKIQQANMNSNIKEVILDKLHRAQFV